MQISPLFGSDSGYSIGGLVLWISCKSSGWKSHIQLLKWILDDYFHTCANLLSYIGAPVCSAVIYNMMDEIIKPYLLQVARGLVEQSNNLRIRLTSSSSIPGVPSNSTTIPISFSEIPIYLKIVNLVWELRLRTGAC